MDICSTLSRFFGNCISLVIQISIFQISIASAQTVVSENPTPKVSYILEDGLPPTINWGDGRVAQLKIWKAQSSLVQSKFEVFENTCDATFGQKCTFNFQILNAWTFMSWSEHPDPSKLGSIVVQAFNNGLNLTPMESDVVILSDSRNLFPIAGSKLQASFISCKDYSWIPQATKSAPPKDLIVPHWSTEVMTENPETGVNENRIFSSAVNVKLERNTENQLSIANIEAVAGLEYLVTDGDAALSMKKENGELCQVTLKFEGIQKAIAEINKINESKPSPNEILDYYTLGSDEVFYSGAFPLGRQFLSWIQISPEGVQ